MYLTESITSDKTYRMCGILPASAEMTNRIKALGYVKGESIGNRSFLPSGLPFSGHEFHYSRIEPVCDARYAFRLSRGKGIEAGCDGLISQNVLGCFTHAYFKPAFARAMIESAVNFSRQ